MTKLCKTSSSLSRFHYFSFFVYFYMDLDIVNRRCLKKTENILNKNYLALIKWKQKRKNPIISVWNDFLVKPIFSGFFGFLSINDDVTQTLMTSANIFCTILFIRWCSSYIQIFKSFALLVQELCRGGRIDRPPPTGF